MVRARDAIICGSDVVWNRLATRRNPQLIASRTLSELGGYLLGRRLYETMLVWETDPSMRDNQLRAAFADVWCALPRVVFSRTLDSVQGNARLAARWPSAAALDATDKDVSIGGAGLAAQAFELGLVDELRIFRHPVVIGGGTPFFPPLTGAVPLDLIETRTFGSRVITSATGAPVTSRGNTAGLYGSAGRIGRARTL